MLLAEGLRWFLIRMKDTPFESRKETPPVAKKQPEVAKSTPQSAIVSYIPAKFAQKPTKATQAPTAENEEMKEILRDIRIEDVVSPLAGNYDK